MEASILINRGYGETRVALLEDDAVAEVYIERQHEVGLVGNIYKGRVTRVLPGMEAAFLDIGLARAAFLYVDDVWTPEEREPSVPPSRPEEEDVPVTESSTIDLAAQAPRRASARNDNRPPISTLIREGQELLVQVSKDPIGTKGARVTAHITLAGRFTVFMPSNQHVGISKRITDEDERQRLRDIVEGLRGEREGFIVRTEGQGLAKEELTDDMDFLRSMWREIETRSANARAPDLVQPDLDIVLRSTRDLFTREVAKLVVDSAEEAERITGFLEKFAPNLIERVKVHDDSVPLFDQYGVEQELERALLREIPLKSGGSIVIDEAEALTAIDINTGSFVGKQNLESTILRTNLEAAKAVVAQLRLRNIGGIIVVDFIDMESQENRQSVFNTFVEELERDRAKSFPLPISELGVVEMTRKRVRESLGESLTEACPYCAGLGRIRSRDTVCHEIFREVDRQSRGPGSLDLIVSAHPEVAAMLAEDKADNLTQLEQKNGCTIVVQARQDFHQERYEIHRRGPVA